MFGMSGHTWMTQEFVESHPRLNVFVLYLGGALIEGNETTWQWENGRGVYLRADHGQIILRGEHQQAIDIDWLPIVHGSVRARFLCPGCGQGAYHLHLHDKDGMFWCRKCCGYDWRSRHRHQGSAWRRIAQLRKRLARAEAMASGDLSRLLDGLDGKVKMTESRRKAAKLKAKRHGKRRPRRTNLQHAER
jgi:hypothetical protein